MQTFLPYPSYKRSLEALDDKRLGKQRVETLQILNVLTGYRIEGVWAKPGEVYDVPDIDSITGQPLLGLDGEVHTYRLEVTGRRKVALPQSFWYLDPSAKGWGNHPMTRMWEGSELSLLKYGLINCRVWTARGYADTCFAKMRFLFPNVTMADINAAPPPSWMGLEALHHSHQTNLVDKAKQFYLHHADKPHRPHGTGARRCDGDTPHKPHKGCEPKSLWHWYRPMFPDVPVSKATDDVAVPYVWPL